MRVPSAVANQVLDGKYRLDTLLGQGGMGAVFDDLEQRYRGTGSSDPPDPDLVRQPNPN